MQYLFVMKKNKNKNLSKKLKRYGALVAAVSGTSQSDGAIVYTDVSPDFAGGIGSQYFLDLNNDGTDDFRIYSVQSGSSSYSYVNLYIEPLGANNDVLGSGSSNYAYPFALNSGQTISAGGSSWFNNGYGSGYQSMVWGYSNSLGNWPSATDKYLGLRIQVGGNTYYGWARLDVNADGSSFTVKDYAYEDVANLSINAGATTGIVPADPATMVVGADVAENANGLDLLVDFTAAANEATVNEYRIMAVKAASAGAFDLAAAENIAMGNYTVVAPSGSPTYSQVLTAMANDVDGDLITIGEPYVIFIMSEADPGVATVNALSAGSPSVTLINALDVATGITGTDIDNNSNGFDLQVDFAAASNETAIDEYRILVVKTVNAGSYTIAQANIAGAGQYTPVTPNGSATYTEVLNTIVKDVNGDDITIGVPYSLFILSKGNSGGTIDSLSASSPSFTLNTPADVALNITGTDVANNVNASDVQVDFDAAVNESTVNEYRLFVVKDAASGSFDLAAAQAIGTGSYTVVSPSGASNYSEVLPAGQTDTDGDAIADNVDYRIFILSIQNGTTSNLDDLSAASPVFTLTNAVGIDELIAESIKVYHNGSGLYVDIPSEINEPLDLTIFSVSGQAITSETINGSGVINLDKNAKGIYLVQFSNKSGENILTRRISF